MKESEKVTEFNDMHHRANCLETARGVLHENATPEELIVAAKSFYAFVSGGSEKTIEETEETS